MEANEVQKMGGIKDLLAKARVSTIWVNMVEPAQFMELKEEIEQQKEQFAGDQEEEEQQESTDSAEREPELTEGTPQRSSADAGPSETGPAAQEQPRDEAATPPGSAAGSAEANPAVREVQRNTAPEQPRAVPDEPAASPPNPTPEAASSSPETRGEQGGEEP